MIQQDVFANALDAVAQAEFVAVLAAGWPSAG